MKKYIRVTTLMAAMTVLASCGEPMSEEQRRLLEQDQKNVMKRVNADLSRDAGNFIDACLGKLDAAPVDDTRLTKPPYKKASKSGTVSYRGHWRGQHGYELDGPLMEASSEKCDFAGFWTEVGGSQGRVGNYPQPNNDFVSHLRKSGYSVSAFMGISAGGQAVSAGLKALIPGPNLRLREGSMTAVKGSKKLTIKVFSVKDKQSFALVRRFMRVTKN